MPNTVNFNSASSIREVVRPVNGLSMNIATCGDGPAMVLLHGFPDHWRVWRPLMEHVGDMFTLFAPDQRGYNLTSRPPDLADYQPECLVADAAALIRSLGDEPVCLVAHDWGAMIAFWLAIDHPHLLKCLTILNGAHPYLYQDAIWDDPNQRAASQYIATLRSPDFEARMNVDGGNSLANEWFGVDLASGRMTAQDFEAGLEAWRRPGAWTAMLNWYRAAPFTIPKLTAPPPATRWTEGLDYQVKVPVQVIWGEKDLVFSPVLVEALRQHAAQLDVHRLPGAGHVPQRDDPETCAFLIGAFAKRFL